MGMTTKQILQWIHDWALQKVQNVVYDISAAHPDGQGNPTPYADLTAALGTGGVNIPEDIRKGGMSIKFIQGTVQSSDNKYVQFRLKSSTWSAYAADWENVSSEIDVLNEKIEGIVFDDNITFNGYNIVVKEFSLKSNTKYIFDFYSEAEIGIAYISIKSGGTTLGSVKLQGHSAKITIFTETDYNDAQLIFGCGSQQTIHTICSSSSNLIEDVNYTSELAENIDSTLGRNVMSGGQALLTNYGYLDTNGEIVSNQNYKYTDKIKVAVGQIVTFASVISSSSACFLVSYNRYGITRNSIVGGTTTRTYTVENGDEYIRLCCWASSAYNFKCAITPTGFIKATDDRLNALEANKYKDSKGLTIFNAEYIAPEICENNEWNTSGSPATNSNAVRFPYYIKVESGKSYIVKCNSNYYIAFYFYDKNGDFLSMIWFSNSAVSYRVFTTPSNACFVRVAFRGSGTLDITTFTGAFIYDLDNNNLSTFAYQHILFKDVFIDHMFMDEANRTVLEQIIPAQSLFNINIAKRLGFHSTEASINKTSDNKYIVLHGISGAFGYEVTDLNGTYQYADTQINTKTLEWIKANMRYRSKYAKYRTEIPTLEEWLTECKKLNIVPFLKADTDAVIDIVESIMGKDNYMTWGTQRNRARTLVQISDLSTSGNLKTASQIVSICNGYGKPCAYGFEVSLYTEEELKERVDALHSAGYLACWNANYTSEVTNQKCLKAGLDLATSGWNIPEFESGNLCNLAGDATFSDFTHNGSVDSGILTLEDGDTIVPNATLNSLFLAGGSLHIKFNGTIHLSMGKHIDNDFTSDGSQTMWFSSAFIEEVPTFAITAVGEVVITDILYKASKM